MSSESSDGALLGTIFAGAGEMAARLRGFDWASSPLGPPRSWPQSLRTALTILSASAQPTALAWGPDYRLFYNDAYAPILGIKHPAALGAPCARVFAEAWDKIGRLFDGVARSGEPIWRTDDRFVFERGGAPEECWFSFSYSALRDEAGSVVAIWVSCEETTQRLLADRRRTEAQRLVAQSERRFRALIEKSWDAVAFVDATGRFAYVSPSVSRILGAPAEAFVGQNAFASMHPEDIDRVRATFGEVLAQPGGSRTLEYRYRHTDGGWRWLEVTGTNLLDDLDVGAVAVNFRDGTERLERDRALLDRTRELEALLERHRVAEARLLEADRRKNEFLAMLGHELRNPLSALANAVSVLTMSVAPDHPAAPTVPMLARQTRKLGRMVDDLLEIGRLESGKMVLQREPCDLAEIVRKSLDALRAGGKLAAHELRARLDPVWVDGDATRIEQIVGNLVENAIRYSPEHAQIDVVVEARGDEALLRITDQGVGIDAALLPNVFDFFVQGKPALGASHGELGVGLSIVRRLVELHGGKVEAASGGAGRGSEFVVSLPRRAPAVATTASEAVAPARPLARRVLVIDDHEDGRQAMKMLLEILGHEVVTAVDGLAGVAAAESCLPDIAFVDIALPGIDGYEVARRIRSGPASRATLVALTGYGQPQDRDQAASAGFDLHVTKPADPDRIRKIFDDLPCPVAAA